jgi:predicted dehydrogenase
MPISTLCRWGILSTAAIAKKNWRAIAQSTHGTVAAVASRRLDAAQHFVSECQSSAPQLQTPDALGDYDALLNRNDIDAVYIPLPTGLRKEWIIKAAKRGKHILAEKPAALSSTDLEEILAVCQANSVQFMDGVMFMHSARLAAMRQTIDDGHSIGQMKRIACQFSFFGGDDFAQRNIRVDSALEPFGCLGDLGWYCIRFLLWANRWQMPTSVIGNCLESAQGPQSKGTVPADFSAELKFPDGVSASFYCSFNTGNQQWAHVSGTQGNLFVKDFVLPHHGCESSYDIEQPRFETRVCDFHMQEHTQRIALAEYSSGHSPAQEINMINKFNEIVLSKRLEPHWPAIALATQKVMDQLMA